MVLWFIHTTGESAPTHVKSNSLALTFEKTITEEWFPQKFCSKAMPFFHHFHQSSERIKDMTPNTK